MKNTQRTGVIGEYYVAYKLSIAGFTVGLTVGNTPGVDLIICSEDGLKSLTIQVKTSRYAYRPNRYKEEGFEWDVGINVINKHSVFFWYAFVDLKENVEGEPDVYIVPSIWVSEFVKPDFTRKVFFLPKKASDLTKNNWDLLSNILLNDNKTIEFAQKWNEEILVRWGS